MIIRIGTEFLDFSGEVEVEKQIKLFEEISTTDGDFSYAFDLEKTLNNLRLLGNPFPDNISKPVYQKIPAVLMGDSGAELYYGYIRIERITNVIECSFFAGNNNWFGLLSESLRSLNWSIFDVDQTEDTIQAAIFNTSGIVFPLVDNGLLDVRGYQLLKVEDFVAGIYVKTVFNKIFSSHGIKIKGELLKDTNYLTAITLKNGKSQEQIDARTSFVNTTNSPSPHDATYHKMLWTDDSTFPYSDGDQNNFDLPNSRYIADVKMTLKSEWTINESIVPGAFGTYKMAYYINGVLSEEKNITLAADTTQFTAIIRLEAGDILETYVYNDATVFADPITHANWRITPFYIYRAFGDAVVPDWTQQQYVSNILRLFNVLTHYESKSKTLTFNLFEKIKSKDPIDLSEHISETEIDYTDFISSYGKKSYFSYKELTEENFRPNHFAYEKGVINVDNDFLNNSEDVLESDFTQPIGYINPVFDMSIERTKLINLEEEINVEATAVTNNLGNARFAISEDVFELSDMVRVSNSTNPKYNGDYMVVTLGAGFIQLSGLQFDTDATATIAKMNYVYEDTEDVFLLHQVPLYSVPKFSGHPQIRVENTDLGTMAIAFFNLLNTGRQVNDDFIYSLSFSGQSNPMHYQLTLIDQYFRLFGQILNDPVKLLSVAHLPYALYEQIDFLRPITIKTMESQNQYYLNRISGYKQSYMPCEVQLIKL